MGSSTDRKYFHAWKKICDWCDTNGFDPFKASDQEVAAYLSTRAEITASPNVVEGDYFAIKAIRAQSVFSLDLTPILMAVWKGLKKAFNPGDLKHIGFTPEQIQALLKVALANENCFVSLRLATTIVVCFWCTARYEEASKLSVGNVMKQGLSMRVMINKDKHNLEMKPQLAVIHPNSKEAVGNLCPVKIHISFVAD